MKRILAAAFAALVCSASAHAALNGTNLTLSVNHVTWGGQSAVNNVTHTYGTPSAHVVPLWGTLNVTSPAIGPSQTNSIKLDFTAFNYSAFTGPFATVGTATLTNLAEAADVASVQLYINGAAVAGVATASGNGFAISWSTQAVFIANSAAPNVSIGWNSAALPAPGALALLGIAGLTARPRRRRG